MEMKATNFLFWKHIAATPDEILKQFEGTSLIFTLTARREFARQVLNSNRMIGETEQRMMDFYNDELKKGLLIT